MQVSSDRPDKFEFQLLTLMNLSNPLAPAISIEPISIWQRTWIFKFWSVECIQFQSNQITQILGVTGVEDTSY